MREIIRGPAGPVNGWTGYPRGVVPADPTARSSPVAVAIRACRLIVVLRRVTPRDRLLDLVEELADAGAGVFEVTLDRPGAADDLAAVGQSLDGRAWLGAGTVRTVQQVREAVGAGAAFGVAPVFDRAVLEAALDAGLPFIPGAYSPTEIDAAWRAGATFVKLFPASSLGPSHVRELRGPMPEVETIVTGGVDATNAVAFLEAGATAVGIGSAIVRATPEERRSLIAAIAAAPAPPR
jgi:2-dehydro-3-deoxyphosphogluconate aldolase / (4S)-4-hydroxy-2-oxoglutarate aldolase